MRVDITERGEIIVITKQHQDPLQNIMQAACADRLERMFRRGEAFQDERTDIATALDALSARQTGRNSGVYLQQLMGTLIEADIENPMRLSHEQRVSLYVAAKILRRT